MDSMIFYKPPSASVSRPSRSSVARMTAAAPPACTAAQPLTSTTAITSVGIAGGDTHRNFLRRDYWEDRNRIEVANMTDLAPEGRPPGQPIRIADLIQKQGNSRGARNYLSDDDRDDDIEFPTLEQLLADAKKKRISANAKLSMSENANSRIQDDSPVRCSGSTSSSCQEPIYISDDESDTASQIDNSDLGSDSISEADCNHPFDTDKGPDGGQALSPGTTAPSNRPATDRDNDETNKNNDAIHNVQLQPSTNGYKSALFRSGSISHQARELQCNTKVTTDSTKHVGCEGSDKPEDYVFDVFAEEDESDDSNTQLKQPKDSAVSGRNLIPNTKMSKQQNSPRAAQFPEPALTATALLQSDPKGTLPPAHRPRPGCAERKAARISVFCTKSTASGSTASTNLEPSDAGESHPGKPITDPNNLWKIRTIVGRKIIRSRALYCVEWEPTWELESELAEVKELLNEFEAKLQNIQGQSENGRGKRDRKALVTSPNKLWKVRNIIGRRIIGGRNQYWVDWKPTWEPESDLSEVGELIDKFLAKLENNQGRRGRRGQKRSQVAAKDLDVPGESEPSKRQRKI